MDIPKRQSVTDVLIEQALDDGIDPKKLLLFRKVNKKFRSTKKRKVRKKRSRKK